MSLPADPRNWSNEGQSLAAAIAAEPDRVTNRNRVLAALREGPQTTYQISSIGSGTEGTRRLRELRQMGYKINGRKVPGSRQWEYTLVSEPDVIRNLIPTGSSSKFLCYIRTKTRVDAKIAHSLPSVYAFLKNNWLREGPPNLEELASLPQTWGNGTRRLRWDFEAGGMLLVEHLYHD